MVVVKLLGIFCFFYLGTLFVEGSGAPGGSIYFPWIHAHFYYQDVLRDVILNISDTVLGWMGYTTNRVSLYVLRIDKAAISLNNGCLGYGLMSFWIADLYLCKKIKWLFIGLFLLNFINVVRVCLILLAGYHKWSSFSGLDHHSLFNIAAYILIFILLFFYSKDLKRKPSIPLPTS